MKNNQYTGQAFVNGEWIKSEKTSVFESINPITGHCIWRGDSSDEEIIDRAIKSARNAFTSWRQNSFEQRAEIIRRFVEVLERESGSLAEAIHLETGKPLWEAKTEVSTMIGKYAISLEAYEHRTGISEGQLADFSTRLAHRPIGVFAVLGPYNFPGHLPNGHIIPALLAGNTVVFKPSEQTPLVGEHMVGCWQQSGLPKGVINLVQGARETGEMLVSHPGLKGILFTGSALAGKQIHASLAGQPEKMLALELGGNNPLVVEETANIPAAVYTIVQSAFITAGQRCTCARRLILIDNDHNRELLEVLVEAAKNLKVGDAEDCFMGSVISNQAADKLLHQQATLIESGAQVLLTMNRIEEGKPLLSPGILEIKDLNLNFDDECFGPLLQVYWAKDIDQAIEMANDTEYGLAAGLISDSEPVWQEFYNRSTAGIVNWNRPLTGASGKAPFGGSGSSGNYRPSAYYAADYCAYPVASLLQESVQLPEKLAPGITL